MYNYININHINMIDVRKSLVGFAEQEPILINDSIKYNLTFTKDEVCMESIEKYIQVLNMEKLISNLSLDFTINEKSSNISGGEKQKISILKVLHKDAPVMIFDEPTSALDSIGSKQLLHYLNEIKKINLLLLLHMIAMSKTCLTKLLQLEVKYKV